MRGESIVHAFVVLCFALIALSICIEYDNFVLVFRDIAVGIFLSGFTMILCTTIITMKESNYFEKGENRYLENIPWVVMGIRFIMILALSMSATVVWNIGIMVDGIFIYLLFVWGYCISLVSLTIAELVFAYKGKNIL